MLSASREATALKFEDAHVWREWPNHSKATRTALKIPETSTPLAKINFAFRDIPLRSQRWRDVLEVAFASVPHEQRAQALAGGFYIDLSQCVSRKKWGFKCFTMTSSTVLYDLGRQTICTGRQHLALQGFPDEVQTGDLEDGEIRKLAGQAIFLPNLATVLLAVFLCDTVPWWDIQPSHMAKRHCP